MCCLTGVIDWCADRWISELYLASRMAEEPIKPALVGVQESCSAGYGDTHLSLLSLPEVQQPQPKQVEEPPLSDKDRQAILLELAECMVSDMDALSLGICCKVGSSFAQRQLKESRSVVTASLAILSKVVDERPSDAGGVICDALGKMEKKRLQSQFRDRLAKINVHVPS